MKNTICDLVLSRKDNKEGALMLLEAPTGFGKTYQIGESLRLMINDPQLDQKKFIFFTPLKKNLNVEGIKERLGKDSNTVLFLDSNLDSFKKGYEKVEKNIYRLNDPELTKLFQETKRWVEKCSEKQSDFEYGEFIHKKADDSERSFRKRLKVLVRNEKGSRDRYDLLEDAKWAFIKDLYPACTWKDKRIYLMSAKKFLYTVDPIMGECIRFLDNDFLENKVIFIDEFDSVKNIFEDKIIEDGITEPKDLITLFISIRNGLDDTNCQIPKDSMSEEHYKIATQRRGELLQKFNSVFEDYHFEAPFKREEDKKESSEEKKKDSIEKSSFLLFDGMGSFVQGDSKKKFYVVYDPEDNKNLIQFSEDKTGERLETILRECYLLIWDFRHFAEDIASFMKAKTDHSNNDFRNEIEYDDHLKSALDIFLNRQEENIKFLCNNVRTGALVPKVQDFIDSSIYYRRGFSEYHLVNAKDHYTRTDTKLYSFRDTPESILLGMCQNALVIGASATATLPTVLDNFDLSYLKRMLKDRFLLPTAEQQKRIQEEYSKSIEGYQDGRVQVETTLIDVPMTVKQEIDLKKIFKNEKDCLYFLKRIQGDVYKKKRYLKLAQLFQSFASQDDLRSFLCLMNLFPKENNPDFDIDLINDMFLRLCKENKCSLKTTHLVVLRSDRFEQTKDLIEEYLKKGHKVFVMSAYQAIGTGQNLDYPIPESINTVRINSYGISSTKDHDAIYVDRPTHLIKFPGSDGNWNDLPDSRIKNGVKAIMQAERLYSHGEISRRDLNIVIASSFDFIENNKSSKSYPDFKETESFQWSIVQKIIQAIGRISRTNEKNRIIRIYVDKDIFLFLNQSLKEELSQLLVTPEIRSALDCGMAFMQEDSGNLRKFVKYQSISDHMGNVIQRMLKNTTDPWRKEDVEIYNDIRHTLLKNISPTSQELKSMSASKKKYYMEIAQNSIWFRRSGDFGNVTIFNSHEEALRFIHKNKDDDSKSAAIQEISEEKCRLNEFIEMIPGFKSYMESQGYSVSFSGESLPLPAVWDIYKGILGEEAGRFILNSQGIRTEEITDLNKFEKADFKVKGSNVYIDFKNWNLLASKKLDSEQMQKALEKFARKAVICETKCLVICNVLGLDQESPKENIVRIDGQDIRLMRIPGLYDQKGKINSSAFQKLTELTIQYAE